MIRVLSLAPLRDIVVNEFWGDSGGLEDAILGGAENRFGLTTGSSKFALSPCCQLC
jgi:hypothetical protein